MSIGDEKALGIDAEGRPGAGGSIGQRDFHISGSFFDLLDDVAGDLVDKLIRRNPHVFADAAVHDVDEIVEQWEEIKKAEREAKDAGQES